MVKTAEELASQQKEISVSEFFEKNKHLLGFDNLNKALLMAVKEAVDNSLDACEEAGILPDISVKIKSVDEDRFRVSVQDNGPGITKEQIPRAFGKLLYGSKFHRLRQSLTEDEPILVQKDGKVSLVPIGRFVDGFLGWGEEIKDVSNQHIFVPAFDKKTKMYAMKKVSSVIRHKREHEIVKVTLATNRTIKVTGCHSLFTLDWDGNVKEVEARELKPDDFVIVPSKLPEIDAIRNINILDYIGEQDIAKNWFYVYDIDKTIIQHIKNSAEIIHKKTDKSRRYYRIKTKTGPLDILDDSMQQYLDKCFLPLPLVLKLGLKEVVEDCVIVSYLHGIQSRFPVVLELSESFMRFLGLFVAEGHCDRRQIGFTFGKHESTYVREMSDFAQVLGANFTVEQRPTSIRVKIFGGLLSILLKKWCGKGAKNKQIPEFVFRAPKDVRQHFLDALYQGDGHKVKGRNCIMLSTTSKKLANEISYLWLMQGVLASLGEHMRKGLGKNPSHCYVISVYGSDINKSHVFSCSNPIRHASTEGKQFIVSDGGTSLITTNKTLSCSDICLLKVRKTEMINEGYEYVYDLSVPSDENFVGGIGGVACHNSRGQQGIGISAVVLYSQLTTGVPTKIWSRTAKNDTVYYYELMLNTSKNEPEIIKEEIKKDGLGTTGIRVEMELSGKYRKTQGVDDYLKSTSIANPFAKIVFAAPDGTLTTFPRSFNQLPAPPKEMRPHPYGVEFGILLRMLARTSSQSVSSFLSNDFSSIGAVSAKEICQVAKIDPKLKPASLDHAQVEKLLQAMQKVKIQRPPLDCLSPIGKVELEKSLKKEYPDAEFVATVEREPTVYRGNPFKIEVGIVYGVGNADDTMTVLRFANRVPLLYQAGACGATEAVKATDWKRYGLSQSGENTPSGPVILVVHMASVWVPFISESKEAIAPYPDIVKEMKLALQDAGRELSRYLSGKRKAGEQTRRLQIFERYSGEVAEAIAILVNEKIDGIKKNLDILIKERMKKGDFDDGDDKEDTQPVAETRERREDAD
ncbi:MAG: DNA topoisomerase VI subunit B [Candidatus Aenigmarchaeota archaeon]|nr:DNA topoisomerase VI subunit B [Candidatus Aenigmarchaeota archaeon]